MANISVDQQQLAEFCRQRHIRRMAFFWSVLRADFGPHSDIEMGETETFYFSAGAIPDADTSAWEREIDERVDRLYSLTPEEIKIIEDTR
jgi:predicted nucleotidyltransferase